MELSFGNMIKILWRKAWILLLAALVGAAVFFVYTCAAVDKQYTSSAKIYVVNKSDGNTTSSDLSVAKSLVNTYLEIMKSTSVTGPVVNALADTYPTLTTSQIRSYFSGAALNGTEAFQITITTNDPQLSYDIIREIIKVSPDAIKETVDAGSVSIFEEPVLPTSYSWPLSRNTLLGGFLGLILSAAVVLFLAFLDTYVYTRSDLTDNFDYPVIGSIPLQEGEELRRTGRAKRFINRLLRRPAEEDTRTVSEEKKRLLNTDTPFAVQEAYRMARTNILYLPAKLGRCPKYAVTSALTMEGKTISVINLAITMARNNKKVLLIDADMRKPRIAKNLELEAGEGLSEYLAGLTQTPAVLSCREENLFVLPSGHAVQNAAELLSSSRMETLLESLETDYDYIFIDTPPIATVTDAALLSGIVDGYLFAVFAGFSNRKAIREALDALSQVNANIVGFLLNGVNPKGLGGYHSKYGYRYGYGYGEKEASEMTAEEGRSHD